MDLKGLHDVLIESREKDRVRRLIGRKRTHHLNATEQRHLDVEKDQVRLEFEDRVPGLLAVRAFANHGHVVVRLKAKRNSLSCKRLVIDDEDTKFHRLR